MVKIKVEGIRRIMDLKHNIRNMSIISHVGHGKSTLIDSLFTFAGITTREIGDEAEPGKSTLTDSIAAAVGTTAQKNSEEAELGKSTLTDSIAAAVGTTAQKVSDGVELEKSTPTDSIVADVDITAQKVNDETELGKSSLSAGISLYHEMSDESLESYKGERDGNKYLINLIDSPSDSSPEQLTASLRITDGALVLVDFVEGVSVETEAVLRQALRERVKPVLTLNKVDRLFLDLQVGGEEAYQTLSSLVERTNAVIGTHGDSLPGDVKVRPARGTVAFSSGLHGWAFTLANFARMYAAGFGVDEAKMRERLWGDNFYDAGTGKWSAVESVSSKRGFVMLCYDPIKEIMELCKADEKEKLWPVLARLGVTFAPAEKALTGRELLERVMRAWLPAGNSLLEMAVAGLPSPAEAQRYRVRNVYGGQHRDRYANAIGSCDPNGPLVLYVSKVIPAPNEKGRFYAFGRVFAGKVSAGQKVRILAGDAAGSGVKTVERTLVLAGKGEEAVQDVPCGNTVTVIGLVHFVAENAALANEIITSATLTNATIVAALKPKI